ncbi:unnamed protein product, partial [Prorocentrum cordatum]
MPPSGNLDTASLRPDPCKRAAVWPWARPRALACLMKEEWPNVSARAPTLALARTRPATMLVTPCLMMLSLMLRRTRRQSSTNQLRRALLGRARARDSPRSASASVLGPAPGSSYLR